MKTVNFFKIKCVYTLANGWTLINKIIAPVITDPNLKKKKSICPVHLARLSSRH